MSNTKTPPIDSFYKRAFSLVELIVVVAIIGILSGTAYIGIQKGKTRMYNDKILDDITGIANALERYNHDHWGEYPVPDVDGNMNISCFYADATYAHDCASSAFRQGMIDNNLLTRRYMPDVPTDPRTGSRYVYGVSTDGKYFMVGGIYEESDGSFVAKTAGNLKKGYHLPSLIRAFNGPNFVVEDGTNLPYSPDHLIITATLQNMSDSNAVQVKNAEGTLIEEVNPGQKVYTGYEIFSNGSTLDIYYSDGSVSNLDTDSSMEILEGTEVEENDKDGIITKIRIKLTSGKIWNKVARLASASEFNVETTTAIAGVRGTEFGVDVTENQVLLKSGEICRMDLVEDIPVENVKACSGSHTIAGLDDTAGPVIITMNASAGETPATPDTEDLKTLMDEQSKRYLNDNIRPHILKVEEGGVITVANLNSYYSIPVDEYLEVVAISAFTVDGNLIADTSFAIDREELIANYEYTVSPLPTYPFVLRFTDYIGPDSGDSIPITITQETNLTEEDLYGIPESIEWVDTDEEVIICDDTTMMISGDVVFGAGLSTTVVWSATPPSCFDTEEFNVYFGESLPTDPNNGTTPIDNFQYSVGTANPGTTYYWKVEADGMTTIYDSGSKVAPTTPTWCGDGIWNGDEECDGGDGCLMIGADECTCNGDLGWTPVAGGGCECVDSTSTDDNRIITLPNLIGTDAIPINAALTWTAEPICAFENANYSVEIGTTTSITIDNLTDSLLPLTHSSILGSLVPGQTYDWEVTATNVVDSTDITTSSQFKVKCPSTGTIALTTPADNATIENSALNSTSFTWDPADPECYFDETDDYDFEIWADGGTSSIADCNNTVDVSATAPLVNLDTLCIDVLDEGSYIWKVIRDNSSGVIQIYERNFTVTAPATPAPVISGLAIDCSSTGGFCASGGEEYPVTFTVTNATSCLAVVTLESGTGTVDYPDYPSITLTGFDYNTGTGSEAYDNIKITVECDNGVGGTDTEYIDVALE